MSPAAAGCGPTGTAPARCRERRSWGVGCGDGYTLVEVMAAGALLLVLTAVAFGWLAAIRRQGSAVEQAALEQTVALRPALDGAIGALADARPTALCLSPDPDARETPVTDPSACDTVGDHWGYTPTGGTLDGILQRGGAIRSADAERVCFYSADADAVPDPAAPTAPVASCLELTSAGVLQVRSRPPASGTTYLGAAVASSYSWDATSGWNTRVLGRNLHSPHDDPDDPSDATPIFSFTDFAGAAMATPVADALLDDIALIRIELRAGADGETISGTAAVQANRLSPCRLPVDRRPGPTSPPPATSEPPPAPRFDVSCPGP